MTASLLPLAVAALAAAAPAGVTHSDDARRPAVHALLRSTGQFTDADLASVERDLPAARVLRDVDRREIAAFGAVRVRATRDFLLARIRDIVGFKRNPMVLQIGRFSTPPRLEDMDALTLDRDDIDALRRCRPGACALRLPAADMDRIRTSVDWRAADAAQTATRLMREFLLRRVQTYLARGAPGLGEYADKKPPIQVAGEFDRLLASPLLLGDAPALQDYVRRYPADRPARTDEFLYWSKERFGFKPVISVTQVIVHEPAEADLIDAYVVSKQIYASHYFDAAMAVTAVIDAPLPSGGPAFYMMYVNRSRTPMLEGFFAALARGTVRGRTRDGMIETLRLTKARLETDFTKR